MAEKKYTGVSSSSHKCIGPTELGPYHYDLIQHLSFLTDLISNTFTWELRASVNEFGGGGEHEHLAYNSELIIIIINDHNYN